MIHCLLMREISNNDITTGVAEVDGKRSQQPQINNGNFKESTVAFKQRIPWKGILYGDPAAHALVQVEIRMLGEGMKVAQEVPVYCDLKIDIIGKFFTR